MVHRASIEAFDAGSVRTIHHAIVGIVLLLVIVSLDNAFALLDRGTAGRQPLLVEIGRTIRFATKLVGFTRDWFTITLEAQSRRRSKEGVKPVLVKRITQVCMEASDTSENSMAVRAKSRSASTDTTGSALDGVQLQGAGTEETPDALLMEACGSLSNDLCSQLRVSRPAAPSALIARPICPI